jgi:hypothetical protein
VAQAVVVEEKDADGLSLGARAESEFTQKSLPDAHRARARGAARLHSPLISFGIVDRDDSTTITHGSETR